MIATIGEHNEKQEREEGRDRGKRKGSWEEKERTFMC